MRKEVIIDLKDIPKSANFYELILEFAKNNNPFSYPMLKMVFKYDSESTIRRYLQKLCDHDQLIREKCLCGQGYVYRLPSKKKSVSRRG